MTYNKTPKYSILTMNSKQFKHTAWVVMASAVLTTACTFEQEDYFDESAALRITHLNENIQQRLVSQSDAAQGKHGWVIQYFVAGTDDYDFEGFNLLGRFSDNGTVTLASDHRFLRDNNAGKYTEHTSAYQMLAEEGPVLSFNTWNDILTVFEDPVDPSQAPRTIVQNGEGMNGDHNLVLRSYDENEITFRGERHSAIVRFVPCDRPWADYLAATTAMKNYITNSDINSYYVINGTDTMYFVNLRRGYFTYAERVYDPLLPRTEECVFTPDGFRLQHADTIAGATFQEFRMAADSTCLVSEDGKVRVIATWDEFIQNHAGIWTMKPELFTPEQQTLFTQIDAAFKQYNSSTSLASIGLGRSTGGNAVAGLVFTFYTNKAKTKTNTVGLALHQSKLQFGQFKIESNSDDAVDKNMEAINKVSPNLINLARSFAATLVGTYNVMPNNHFLPTGAKFTAVDGSSSFEIGD